ncbi:MAG: amidohydrolase [Bacteroidota bacterium]
MSTDKLDNKIEKLANKVEPKVIEWRRDIHQNPELGNREFRTAKKVAEHLASLGIEVQTGVAHTGVVGLLKGGKPGGVVALRADMDALPVVERTDVPFASKVKSTFNGQEVGVMHACGHDTHVAILMGVAEVLSSMRDEIQGTVKFIFQPAEEGPPEGEEGGAKMMVKEGVLKNPDVDAIFGLHISALTEVGQITFKLRGAQASADTWKLVVKGRQTHGSTPWNGVDPIYVSNQILTQYQGIISRELELTNEAAVISVGRMVSGVRANIIPEEALMEGTIRSLDQGMREKIHQRMREIAEGTAAIHGATAILEINEVAPIVYNDPDLTAQMVPSLQKMAGERNVTLIKAVTPAEDFAYYQEQVPGFYFGLGGMTPGADRSKLGFHHTPDFYVDESGLVLGVKSLSILAVDYLLSK